MEDLGRTDGERQAMKGLDYRLSLITFLGLLALADLSLALKGPGWAASTRGLPLYSRGLVRDRLLASAGKPVVLMLGDSVLYGAALREHGIRAWRDQTPAAYLGERLPGRRILNLSDEGLFPQDLLALNEAAQGLHPQAVVVELNYRMLCEDAGDARKALTRDFLRDWLPQDIQGPVPAAKRADMAGLSAWVQEHWRLLRYAGAWTEAALPGGTKRWMGERLAAIYPPQESVDADVLLNLKIRPYYQAPEAGSAHLGLRALDSLAKRLSAAGVPVLVFLTPQNLPRVADFLDRTAYDRNRAQLALCFRRPGIRYRDWSDLRPGGAFLDHCHLDAAGNRALAERMAAELEL